MHFETKASTSHSSFLIVVICSIPDGEENWRREGLEKNYINKVGRRGRYFGVDASDNTS